MTAVPAETGSRLAARALALALVQVLALGLPDPDSHHDLARGWPITRPSA